MEPSVKLHFSPKTQVCLKPPVTYNTKRSLAYLPKTNWFEHIRKYGLSSMHMRPRTMEAFLKATRARDLRREEVERGEVFTKEERKARKTEMKKSQEQAFIDRSGGLRIDFPDTKVSLFSGFCGFGGLEYHF